MTNQEAKEIKPGDMVFWNDPDEETCSKLMTVKKIVIVGDVIKLTAMNGDYLEGYAEELCKG